VRPVRQVAGIVVVGSIGQHGWPAPPQAWQVPVPCTEQKVFGAVQTQAGPGISQHGCESPPHPPHALMALVAEQVPPSDVPFGAVQVAPAAMHFV
jgi:hypothetical protein